MIAYICDNCGERQPPQKSYQLPPAGWFSVSKQGTYETVHYCSPACLLKRAETEVAATCPVEAPPSDGPVLHNQAGAVITGSDEVPDAAYSKDPEEVVRG